jgi:hypothetical protein
MASRSLQTGDGQASLVTASVLDLDGESAKLTRARRLGPPRGNGPWDPPVTTETMSGSMRAIPDPLGSNGRVYELLIGEGSMLPIDCICRETTVDVAAATAMRAPGDDCPTPHWVPPATERVVAWKCTPRDLYVSAAPSAVFDGFGSSTFYFAQPPGIETVWVKEECMVGGGFRRIAADGSIAHSR